MSDPTLASCRWETYSSVFLSAGVAYFSAIIPWHLVSVRIVSIVCLRVLLAYTPFADDLALAGKMPQRGYSFILMANPSPIQRKLREPAQLLTDRGKPNAGCEAALDLTPLPTHATDVNPPSRINCFPRVQFPFPPPFSLKG